MIPSEVKPSQADRRSKPTSHRCSITVSSARSLGPHNQSTHLQHAVLNPHSPRPARSPLPRRSSRPLSRRQGPPWRVVPQLEFHHHPAFFPYRNGTRDDRHRPSLCFPQARLACGFRLGAYLRGIGLTRGGWHFKGGGECLFLRCDE